MVLSLRLQFLESGGYLAFSLGCLFHGSGEKLGDMDIKALKPQKANGKNLAFIIL